MEKLEYNPVVAAVKSWEGLKKSLDSECGIVFCLFGSIVEIPKIVDELKINNKLTFIHLDLVDGLSPKEAAVDYVRAYTKADGIISTKANLVRYASALGLLTVQRFFILDSIAMRNTLRQLPEIAADAIEILPGIMPKIFREVAKLTKKPIIAGGLISDKEDILSALEAGATAISSTSEELWFI